MEIDASAGGTGMPTGVQKKNVAPTISVTSPSKVTLPGPLPLTARVTDDGLPPGTDACRRNFGESPSVPFSGRGRRYRTR